MREIRRLLVALDLHRGGRALTAGSCIAAEQGLDVAAGTGSEVVLWHSTASDHSSHAEEPAFAAAAEEAAGPRRPVLEEVADRFRTAGIATVVATNDEAAPIAIIRRVLRDRIDLVIAGKRNAQRRADPCPGSVSLNLLRECPCAVCAAVFAIACCSPRWRAGIRTRPGSARWRPRRRSSGAAGGRCWWRAAAAATTARS